ncbi:hypothetical protein QGN23_04545 [Chryseobacterium gotjawalense]|uniref:Uncharacterized protein n=1 Tax=Chryseobacterium gotjawalense TaxID=3042315 RepID=A0ABY8RFR9_9FLAO|nr:hypothetical protein [Chryseobacterium sp. wdc7]WHF52549.1 hypothetical protein QGN23_04545 [Chryseobacterium sp. wdc7]
MKYTYLKIELDEISQPEKSNFFITLLEKFLSTIIPKANPDFENQIQNTRNWLIEFNENEIPTREIGLNLNSEAVCIAPWKNNYGFLTDTSYGLQDFKNGFEYSEIEKEYFDNQWNQFNENNL